MKGSTTVARMLHGVIISVAGLVLACQAPPTATDDAGAGGGLAGRYNDNGATFWSPDGSLPCAVVDGVGALVLAPCAKQLATPSGNAKVEVRASGVFNPTGQTVHWGPDNPGYMWAFIWSAPPFSLRAPPYPCGVKIGPGSTYFVDIVFTLNWHATVTPQGEATVTCHYSDEWAWLPPLP